MSNLEDSFMLRLARAIQTWLWVETELLRIYAVFMQGANSHLVSATFNSIISVDAKLALLNSCFTLVFERGGKDLKAWKALFQKLEKLNKKRNKLVHEPVSIHYDHGKTSVLQGPSFLNAMALVKGQTTHQGEPVVGASYNPSKVHILEDHWFTEKDLVSLEKSFELAARELIEFRKSIEPKVAAAIEAAKGSK